MSYYSLFNVQGICPQTKPSKVPYLSDIVIDKNQVFLALTETWLSDDILPAELQISGYTLFLSDRVRKKSKRGRLGGGVCLYVRYDYATSFKPSIQFSNGVVELLLVYSKTRNFCIIVIYRQPDHYTGYRSTSSQFKEAIDVTSSFISSLDGPLPNIIFCGDFNLPHICWPDGTPLPLASKDERLLV